MTQEAAVNSSSVETKKKRRPFVKREPLNKQLSQWESIRREKAKWMRPFSDLSIDRAMAYLEDLRRLTEDASRKMNERINNEKGYIKCAAAGCGISLDGLRPNGTPKYIGKHDYKDPKNPEIIRSV